MEFTRLYGVIVTLALITILGGVTLVVLGTMKSSSAISRNNASLKAIGNASTSIASIFTDWLALIVLVIIAGVIIYIVLNSFGGGAKRN